MINKLPGMKLFSTNRFINAALLLSLLASCFVFFISVRQSKRVKSTSRELTHTQEVTGSIDRIISITTELQAGAREYARTGKEEFRVPVRVARKDLEKNLAILLAQEGKNPAYTRQLDSLQYYIRYNTGMSDAMIALRNQDKRPEAAGLAASGQGRFYTERIRSIGEAIKETEERKLMEIRQENELGIFNLNLILYCGLGAVLLLSLAIFTRVKSRYEEHRAGEEKFRSLLESAPDATIISNTHGTIIMANRQAENLFGYSGSELLGMKVELLIPEELRQRHIVLREQYVRKTGSGVLSTSGKETRALRKDQTLIPVEISISPIETQGGKFITASIRDISQREKAQAQIQQLFTQINQASEAICVTDDQLVIQTWNKGAESLYGFSAEEAMGENFVDLLKAQINGEEYRNAFGGVTQNDYWAGDVRHRKKNGEVIYVHSSLSAIRNPVGKIDGYVSVGFDISEEKKLREQVNHLASIVEQSTEAIISVDSNRQVISWNKGAENLHGYTMAEAKGKTLQELELARFTPEEVEESMLAMTKEGVWKKETELYHKNGSSFFGAITGNPVFNENGEMHSVVFFEKDISLRKELEVQLQRSNEELEAKVQSRTAEIRQSEKQYRYLFENNPMPMLVFDLDSFLFLDVNEMAMEKYGYSRLEFLDKKLTDILIPADRERFRKFSQVWEIPFADAGNRVWRHSAKDRTEMDMEVNTHFIYFRGKKAGLVLLNDVTSRLKAERELVAREKKFRALIENSYDVITMLDENLKVIYRSPSATRITGVTNEESLGMDGVTFIHPDDKDSVSVVLQELLKIPGRSLKITFRYRCRDGSYIWVEGNCTNLLRVSEVKAIVFNLKDITRMISAQEEIMASEERYRLALENMIEGVQIIGFDWRYKYVNQALADQVHITKDQLIGATLMEAFPGIEETELYGSIRRCFKERAPFRLESRFVLPDKRFIWAQLSIQPVPEGVFILSVDITEKVRASEELKEEQQKLESIAASSPGLIYSFQMKPDRSLNFPYASNAFEDIFGYSHDLIKTDISKLLNATVVEDRQLFLDRMMESAREMKPWKLEFRYHHPVKGLIWLEGSSIPAKDPDGGTTWYGIIMDVTERRRIQEKVNEQSAQLKTLSNNLPGVMIYQLAGESFENRRFTYVSSEVTRLTGKTPEEVIKDPSILYEIILEEDRPKLLAAERRAYENFSVFNEEIRCRSVEGEIRWLNIVSSPRKTEQGLLVWDGFHMDITGRKVAEDAIRESEEKYRMLVDHAFDGILFYDEKGQILDCNNSATVNTGYSREELLQMNVGQLFYEQDLAIRPLDIESVIREKQLFDFRTMRKKGGVPAEIELLTRVMPDGRFIAMGRDITEQNQALSQQNLLSSIVNFSDDAIISMDLNGIITSWNKGAEHMYGYSEAEMLGTDIGKLAPDPGKDDEHEWMLKIKNGEYVEHYETKRKRKDGRLIYVSISASPLFLKGVINGISKIVRDITREKMDEDNLRISNERYESVAKATSDAIWDFDYATNKTFIAGTGYKYLFGYPLVNTFSEPEFWESRLHPDDKERVLAEMERAKSDKTTSQSSIEYRFRKADGTYAYLNDRFFIIRDEQGNPLRLLGAKQDITQRKEAEEELKRSVIEKQILLERLSVILNTLPASVALLNTKGVVVEVNEAWKVFSDENGFSGENYGIGNSYLTISTQSFGDNEEDGKKISMGIHSVLAGKVSQFEYEYSWHLPRLKRWFRIVVTPLTGKEFTGAVVMHMDISEIRRLEQERIESKIEEQKKITEAMLKGQEKERNAIGIELHDNVNQILVGTKVLLSVMRDFPEREEELVPTCIENISLAIQENRKIAHELVTPNLTVENLLQQITRLGQTMLKNAGINVFVNHESFNETLLTDDMKLALYRVVQEQCTNIIKYAAAGQVIISLTTKKDLFYMRIADDGNGMDPGQVTHGIGFKNISSRLGVFSGTVNIETAPGNGFALEIEIPLVKTKSLRAAG